MRKYWLDFGDTRPIIESLPGNVRQRVKQKIISLSVNPRPPEALALDQELTGYYRIKIDQYRIIYTIKEEVTIVVIARVAKRDNETYKGLPTIE